MGTHDHWLRKQVTLNLQALPEKERPAYLFLEGCIGTVERYADERDSIAIPILYLHNPPLVFCVLFPACVRPFFAPPEYLILQE